MNEKYSDGLNIINILQCEEDSGIINKVCIYLLEFYFDIDFEESEDANDENPKIKDENSDENISIKKKINNDESLLIFEEFFPIQNKKLHI